MDRILYKDSFCHRRVTSHPYNGIEVMKMKELIMSLISIIFAYGVMSGCSTEAIKNLDKTEKEMKTEVATKEFEFDVNPKTFELSFQIEGEKQQVSKPLPEKEVSEFKDEGDAVTWQYPKENMEISIQKESDYLDVSIKSKTLQTSEFTWPSVEADSYYLPINEGKHIPSDDEDWKQYFSNNEYDVIEYFSMQFFTLNRADYAIVFVIENPFNNQIQFSTEDNITFNFKHEFPSINEEKEYGFRIYVTDNNPVNVSKIYKNYIIEQGQFITLSEKAANNENISKLYGAPFVYFWDKSIISEADIQWNEFRTKLSPTLKNWIQELLLTKVEEGAEMAEAFDTLISLDYTDKYTKNQVLKGLNAVMMLEEFYDEMVFTHLSGEMKTIVSSGISQLNAVQLIEFNKQLLKSELGNILNPTDEWASSKTIDVIKEMYDAGLTKMWIGLDDWNSAYMNPIFIKVANQLGYLVGPYDSYHSIHQPGKEEWETAKFEDQSLFEEATIEDESGEKYEGFQGVGRKLNPTLSLDSVKNRVRTILETNVAFNSWFIDCDATGEIYDDYSADHPTTQKQDLQARLERMAYIRDQYQMVIGSEGGNDFANQTIAFAHGISTPEFSWMDTDMKKNKESEYYVGRYYSSYGGVPEVFSKQVPVKEQYKKIFMDMTYTIPLYKLVYNDSTITTHHWLWGTLKVEDEVARRMLYEVAYNIPPLYHLDEYEWTEHQEEIISHTKIWSEFSQTAIQQEMTDFKILSEDRLVQMTQYGENLKVLVNFSDESRAVEDMTLEPQSLIIFDGNQQISYSPAIK